MTPDCNSLDTVHLQLLAHSSFRHSHPSFAEARESCVPVFMLFSRGKVELAGVVQLARWEDRMGGRWRLHV